MNEEFIKTTQDAFSSLCGHVAHGTIIQMNNGDELQIMSLLAGWQVIQPATNQRLCEPIPSAAFIESLIVKYPHH